MGRIRYYCHTCKAFKDRRMVRPGDVETIGYEAGTLYCTECGQKVYKTRKIILLMVSDYVDYLLKGGSHAEDRRN